MILFSDFDETLHPYDNPQTFSRNLEVVQKFRILGNHFCLATGRSLASLERIWPDYPKFLDSVILDNGSVALDASGKTLAEWAIDLETANQLTTLARDQVDRPEDVNLIAYYDMMEKPTFHQPVAKLRFWYKNNDAAQKLTTKISQQLSDKVKAYAAFDVSPGRIKWIDRDMIAFVDIVAKESGKENAIMKVSSIIAPGQKIVTVGDGSNDLAMLQEFDGYAVENADPEILQAIQPSHIVPDVASLIEKLIAA